MVPSTNGQGAHHYPYILGASVSTWAGNLPVIAAGILCAVREARPAAAQPNLAQPYATPAAPLRYPLPASAATAPAARLATATPAAQPRTLSCPRCKATVLKPAVGAPVCPRCSYPKADTRAAA